LPASLGTVDNPFNYEEQAWRLLIWRVDDMVFLMSGDDDFFQVRITVPVVRYLSAWAAFAGP